MTSSPNAVYIVDGVRTPIGKFKGSLKDLSAHDLGAVSLKALLARNPIDLLRIDQVIIGQVYTAGCGQNPARQTAIHAGIPVSVPAYTLNMLCGSGLKSVFAGASSILLGESKIVVCGGQESMTQAPFYTHDKADLSALKNTLFVDGLNDAFQGYAMGITAENIVDKYAISRHDQEVYAVNSQNKAEHASKEGRFKRELVPVVIEKDGQQIALDVDEFIKSGCTLDTLAAMKPCFKPDGTVTAGTSSGINDGSAMVLLMDGSAYESYKASQNLPQEQTPLARIVAWAEAGVDPAIMGTGPIPATLKALDRAGWSMDDVDLFEFNEAFAAQSLAVIRGLGANPDKCNVNGGALALGHPLACSGTRVLVTLAHALAQRNLKRGVAALCVGGGMGVAICIETL